MVGQAADQDTPVLTFVEGPLRGQWVMYGDELIVGRGADCNIVIPERQVSKRHLRIWRENDRFLIEDLDSKNGTHVNGEQLDSARELAEGDEIQIALCAKMRFVGLDPTEPLDSTIWDNFGDEGLTLDSHTHQVHINGVLLDPPLSLQQFRLLELLYQHSGGVCNRDAVVRYVWPDDAEAGISEQAIDALVRRLRDRLAEYSGSHQFVVTVRGHGFRLEQPGNG
jgi:DNA-binding winged helix-turn-helix (wHTH) protein